VNLSRAAAFILAVVPFEQTAIDCRLSDAKPASAQVRAARCKGLVKTIEKLQSVQSRCERSGVSLATLGQGKSVSPVC
jgi:hypothetical protein